MERPNNRILFVLTSSDRLGGSGLKTGAYLSEIAHPYDEFMRAGYEVTMISPQGGKVPLDGVKMDDPINATWMNDTDFSLQLETTQTPWQVQPRDFAAVFFVGGHGAMYDLPDHLHLHELVAEIYENQGVVAAVCHGVAGLVNLRLPDGPFLVKGHEVTCFSNEEEETVGMESVVPFLLEDKLKEQGARVSTAPKFTCNVIKSGRLITGQNPASAAAVARAVIETLRYMEDGLWVPDEDWCDWQQHNNELRGLV